MNEKYGIELELIMDKFNKKMEKVKKAFSGLGNKKIELDASAKATGLIRQLEVAGMEADKLRNKYKLLKEELGSKQQWEVGTPKYIKLQEELAKTEIALQKATIKADNLNDKITALETTGDTIGASVTKGTDKLTKGLEKMTGKIKRFGLSLFSIRSIWALVSKASSAYLSQDTELANRLQSVWAGLGAMLAPIIEGITNILAKAVKYINIFIKALTGVDLLARATSKSMNATAKSAKGLNKALGGFDELNNLDTDTGAGIDAGGFGGLEDVEIDTTWADRIEKFGKWAKKNLPTITSLLTGVATAITLIKLGLSKIKALGIGVAIGGIVYTVQSLLKYLKDGSWSNFGGMIQGIGGSIFGLGITTKSTTLLMIGAVVLLYGSVLKYWKQIKTFLQGGIDWLTSKADWVREHFGVVGESIYNVFTTALQGILNYFDNTFNAIKQNFDGWIKLIKGVFTGDWKLAWEGIKNIFLSIWNEIKAIVIYVVDVMKSTLQGLKNTIVYIINGILSAVKGVINGITSGINVLIRGINKISFNVPDWVPGIGGKKWGFNIPQIPKLAVGTNFVPEDQLAYIHKGEAVIPKKFNSQEYFGNSNDETNLLLNQVIEAIKNIEINPYTTVKDVGKASLQYINNRSRQLGESVVM